MRSISSLQRSLSKIAKEVLKRKWQRRHLEMIFCHVCRYKFKSYWKIFKCRVSNRNLLYVFDIGDHPTAVTCLPKAAESFKWMSRMAERPSSVNSYLRNCFSTMLMTWYWAARSLTHSHSSSSEKLCQAKHLIHLTLSIACQQNRKNITAWETQFQCFDLLQF